MTTDNIFDSDCDAIINTINCVGNMGGGLAAQFRYRYPLMNEEYQSACARGHIQTGKMWNWWDHEEQRWLINFPTKDDWRDPSELSYVKDGLRDLALVVDDLHLTSLAIPPLGCGLGGLKWVDVEPLIIAADLRCRLEIYPPDGPKYQVGTPA